MEIKDYPPFDYPLGFMMLFTHKRFVTLHACLFLTRSKVLIAYFYRVSTQYNRGRHFPPSRVSSCRGYVAPFSFALFSVKRPYEPALDMTQTAKCFLASEPRLTFFAVSLVHSSFVLLPVALLCSVPMYISTWSNEHG